METKTKKQIKKNGRNKEKTARTRKITAEQQTRTGSRNK